MKKAMKLIGLARVKCVVCGAEKNIRQAVPPNDPHFDENEWKCPNGCKLVDSDN